MRYFVIGADGNKYGPADVATLNQWAAEGRVTPETTLEEEGSGQQMKAKFVLPGMASAPPTQPQAPQQPPQSGFPGQSAPGYTPPGQSPYVRPAGSGSDGQTQIVIGWVCAVVSLFCCPPGFGIAAILLALNAKQKGHPGAQTLMIAAIIMMVVGLAFGVIMALTGNNPFLDMN
jgi:hypothetical protein